MRKLSCSLTTTALVVLATLKACGEMKGDRSSRPLLAGGKVPQRGEFKGALFLGLDGGYCSGSKISDTLILTAAHWVRDFVEKVDMVAPDQQIAVSFETVVVSPGSVSASGLKLRVKEVHFHPSAALPECIAQETEHRYRACADVALIRIQPSSAFTAEASAKVGSAYKPKPGAQAYVGGYGCEAWNSKFEPVVEDGAARQKFGLVAADWVFPASLAFASGDITHFVDAKGVPLKDPDGVLGCPGDSGGPVYLSDKTTVVAVTSGAVEGAIDPSKGFLAYYARLDSRAKLPDGTPLGSWLEPLLDIK